MPEPGDTARCPICHEAIEGCHDLVAALAQDRLNRVPNRDIMDEAEWLQRNLAEARGTPDLHPDGVAYETHRLKVIQAELSRRAKLEAAVREGAVVGRLANLPALLAAVKERVDIREVMEGFGWLPVAAGHGSRYPYRCPHHGDGQDRNASALCYVDEGRWWCFGCNAGGDAVEAVKAHLNMEFGDAVRWLARRYDIALPPPPRAQPPASGVHEALRRA